MSLFAHLDFAEMVLVRQVRLLARRNSALRHFGIIPVCCALDHKVHIFVLGSLAGNWARASGADPVSPSEYLIVLMIASGVTLVIKSETAYVIGTTTALLPFAGMNWQGITCHPFVLRDYSIGSKTPGCRKIPLRCFLPLVP